MAQLYSIRKFEFIRFRKSQEGVYLLRDTREQEERVAQYMQRVRKCILLLQRLSSETLEGPQTRLQEALEKDQMKVLIRDICSTYRSSRSVLTLPCGKVHFVS